MLKKIFLGSILVIFLNSASFSQKTFTLKKIAIIDRTELESSNSEINKLKNAYKLLDLTSCFPQYRDRISKLKKQLNNSQLTQEEKTNKQNELNKLLKLQRDEYTRKEKVILQPILNEISGSLKEFESQASIKVFDFEELLTKNKLIFINPALDVTNKFVKYFNNKNSSTFELEIPDSKIAILNTNSLFDENKGLKNIGTDLKKYNSIVEKKSDQRTDSELNFADNYLNVISNISYEIKEFAYENEINLIFSDQNLIPSELVEIEIIDITEDFTQYFNNKYP